jgi:hypothetical protein
MAICVSAGTGWHAALMNKTLMSIAHTIPKELLLQGFILAITYLDLQIQMINISIS